MKTWRAELETRLANWAKIRADGPAGKWGHNYEAAAEEMAKLEALIAPLPPDDHRPVVTVFADGSMEWAEGGYPEWAQKGGWPRPEPPAWCRGMDPDLWKALAYLWGRDPESFDINRRASAAMDERREAGLRLEREKLDQWRVREEERKAKTRAKNAAAKAKRAAKAAAA